MLTFTNPSVLPLLGLLVPLAIHLWNRRPGREVAVGSLRWLAAGANRRLRRLRLEQVGLLLLRATLLALLAGALAGPQWRQPRPTGRGQVLVSPELADGSRLAAVRPTLDSLRRHGYALRWLAAGLPLITPAEWQADSAGQRKTVINNGLTNSSLLGQNSAGGRYVCRAAAVCPDTRGIAWPGRRAPGPARQPHLAHAAGARGHHLAASRRRQPRQPAPGAGAAAPGSRRPSGRCAWRSPGPALRWRWPACRRCATRWRPAAPGCGRSAAQAKPRCRCRCEPPCCAWCSTPGPATPTRPATCAPPCGRPKWAWPRRWPSP